MKVRAKRTAINVIKMAAALGSFVVGLVGAVLYLYNAIVWIPRPR